MDYLTSKLAELKRSAHNRFHGLAIVLVAGLASQFLSQHYASPVMLFALLIGLALAFLYEDEKCQMGIDLAARNLLRIGVALVGLRIGISDLALLGWPVFLLFLGAIVTTITFGWLFAKLVGLTGRFGVISGGAVGICGASAALAIATLFPSSKETQRDLLLAVVGVTLLSTLAMILYPIIAKELSLNPVETSIFLGGTIHDVAQVVGAGYLISTDVGDLATLAKLSRVAMLVPVVLIMLAIINYKMRDVESDSAPTFPAFLLVFVAFMLLNSFVNVPAVIIDTSSAVSRFFLVLAIVAIGMKSDLRQMFALGWKPVLILLSETIWIALLVLGFLLFV